MASVCIMQPAYLPWIGYFQRIAMSDAYVWLDHVKIDENNKTKFTNRNRILTAKGPDWLTIPYLKHSSPGLIINELLIDKSKNWQKKHWDKIKINYKNAPYFREHLPFFEDYYSKNFDLLTDAIEASTKYMLDFFGLDTPLIKSSSLGRLRAKSELNLDICHKLKAELYIAGPFSRGYLDKAIFQDNGIKVVYHDFVPAPYKQAQQGFVPYLSALDLMFNTSADEARKVLLSNSTWNEN